MLISGFANSINVDKRKLLISNKIKKERLGFFPRTIDFDSIIADGHMGNITFEAIRWLIENNVNLTLLNWNG
ncbi:MAG: hypothetical protein GKS07_09890 [Nitrosopumilus sp.]|nr:MAG: hypothetical protein GKS07_09890 [Nitrosopumilus sp.]